MFKNLQGSEVIGQNLHSRSGGNNEVPQESQANFGGFFQDNVTALAFQHELGGVSEKGI